MIRLQDQELDRLADQIKKAGDDLMAKLQEYANLLVQIENETDPAKRARLEQRRRDMLDQMARDRQRMRDLLDEYADKYADLSKFRE